MGGRRNEKKEKRERKKEFRGKGKKKKEKKRIRKKKSSVGFKPVRLFLLVSCLCNGRGWLEGLVSLFSLPGSHSSLFCRCGPWQSIRPLISQSSSFVLGTRKRGSRRFGLGRVRVQQGNPAALGCDAILCAERAAGRPIEPPKPGRQFQPPWR